MRGRFKFLPGQQFFFQMIFQDAAVIDQHIGISFDKSVYPFMRKKKSNHQIVDQKKGCGTDKPAGNGVVFTDDRILDRVGQCQQNHKIEWIQLRQFSFPGQSQPDNQESINDDGPREFSQELGC